MINYVKKKRKEEFPKNKLIIYFIIGESIKVK